jgi:hypothetical protein
MQFRRRAGGIDIIVLRMPLVGWLALIKHLQFSLLRNTDHKGIMS